MSLPRTLEPETGVDPAEASLYRDLDHREVDAAFVRDLIAGGPVGPRVCDFGCGPASIPILLAQTLRSVTVLAMDLDIWMLDLAKLQVEIAGLLDRVLLQHRDLKRLDAMDDEMVDTVICNSVVHHLADPAPAVASAKRMLRPGGRLFIRDLARPRDEAAVERLVHAHVALRPDRWGDQSDDAVVVASARQLLRQSLHAALTLAEMKDLASRLGIDAACVQMTSDRHWTLDWTSPG